MELKDIKQQLSIHEVLRHYGLQPDRNNRLHCPFHADKTPSLQIYPTTNTYCCFSSNCHAKTGDAIQFIQLKESCNKHEALLKATAMLTGAAPGLTTQPAPAENNHAAVLGQFFNYCKIALPRTKKAVEYLQGRSLDYKQHEVGYNSGGLHVEGKNHHLVEGMEKAGLLKPHAVSGYSAWAKGCIIFPLKDAAGNIVSLYGRSITNDETSKHFYLNNRSGLYPGYPALTTKKLILTESIIDAACLLQQEAIKNDYSILALYGTNGLTEEHTKAIIELPQLEEIICMLDGDEAGNEATAKHTVTLKQLLPEVRISKVTLPEDEDINSVLQTHDDASVLQSLIEERIAFSFSIEKQKAATPITQAAQQSKLNTTNAELLIYNSNSLRIEVLGGIRLTGLDRLKVTLKITHVQKQQLPIRHSFDLYNRVQTEQLIQTISDSFDMNIKQVEATIGELTSALEDYRLQRMEALQPKQEERPLMTETQQHQAIAELKKPNLLQRTAQLLQQCGIVGEASNSLIAYLVYSVRKQHTPLHVMFLGSSGSGKTYLQERISELVPEEDKIEITQITENALYYFKQHELQHKLILIEDLDGALSVFYPLRELQTKRRISKTVTLKDSKGNLKTITITVEGPVCVSGCTTKEKLYEDNANRCILLYTDQTKDQDRRINEYQTRQASGEIDRSRENQYKELFKNMQRMLSPVSIINPYAKYIVLPDQVFKPRRTMTLLLGFIEAVTFYHQYQREVKRDNSGQPYITTTIEDIEAAFSLLKEVLFSKSDELAKATREFLEQLKELAAVSGEETLNSKTIREQLRINPGNMKRYLAELVRYGYIKTTGNRYRKGAYEYTIVNTGEYEALKSSIEAHLESILQDIIQNKVSSSVVQ